MASVNYFINKVLSKPCQTVAGGPNVAQSIRKVANRRISKLQVSSEQIKVPSSSKRVQNVKQHRLGMTKSKNCGLKAPKLEAHGPIFNKIRSSWTYPQQNYKFMDPSAPKLELDPIT